MPGQVINATAYGPTCPQAISTTPYSRQDEDCLNLNVWAPANATGKSLPVSNVVQFVANLSDVP